MSSIKVAGLHTPNLQTALLALTQLHDPDCIQAIAHQIADKQVQTLTRGLRHDQPYYSHSAPLGAG
jgi:hypothetical protein